MAASPENKYTRKVYSIQVRDMLSVFDPRLTCETEIVVDEQFLLLDAGQAILVQGDVGSTVPPIAVQDGVAMPDAVEIHVEQIKP